VQANNFSEDMDIQVLAPSWMEDVREHKQENEEFFKVP
jgi:hypothetical protein